MFSHSMHGYIVYNMQCTKTHFNNFIVVIILRYYNLQNMSLLIKSMMQEQEPRKVF